MEGETRTASFDRQPCPNPRGIPHGNTFEQGPAGV